MTATINFQCPKCKKQIRARVEQAGHRFACPGCGQRLQVPAVQDNTLLGEVVPGRPSAPQLDKTRVGIPLGDSGPEPNPFSFDQNPAPAPDLQLIQPAQAQQRAPDQKFCVECGSVILAKAAICPKCGVAQPDHSSQFSSTGTADGNRIAAGLLGIFLGVFGIHKFVLGYTQAGVIMLVVSLVGSILFLIPPLVIAVIGLIEGILYLSMSDQDFRRIHGRKTKPWF